MIELLISLSSITIIIGAIILMLITLYKPISIAHKNLLAITTLSISLLLEMIILFNIDNSIYLYPNILNKFFIVDKFSIIFDLMFLGGAIFTLAINNRYFINRDYYNGEFFSLILFSLFGMMMLSHSNELISAFISLEVASISIYTLVGYKNGDIKSSEAMLKYIILGALASSFFILGTALIYGVVGSTLFGDIYQFIESNPTQNLSMIIVGLSFILITILFKIGAVPFHWWVLDVYHGAPFPITMFMASIFKIALFSILLRLYLVDFSHFYNIFSPMLISIAIITLLGGSLLAISQTNLKRMLAGSAIVHSGYLLMALSSIKSDNQEASLAIMFYLVSYLISAVGAFGILSFVASHRKRKLTFEEFKGFAHQRPYLGAMMSIFMLSLAGFPSTIGFLGKFYIFMSVIQSGNIALAGFGIIIAFISVYYYFKLIALMYFYPSPHPKEGYQFGITTIFISLLAIATIWGGMGTKLISFLPSGDILLEIAREALIQIGV